MKKAITIISAASLLLCVSCGQGARKDDGKAAIVEQSLPLVNVQTAVKENVVKDAFYASTIKANVLNNIAPQSGGRIQKINVEVGDFVNAGQVLAEMDRVQLDQAALRLKNSKDELARLKSLLDEGGISQSDYEQVELSYKVSKSSYDNVEENTILRSPVSGVVTARNYDRGDMYTMAQPLFVVQQITPVKLLVGISETDYTKVKKGDKVSVTVDALPAQTFTGTIIRLYPVMDASTHTFNVEVSIPNTSRQLRPGMYARVNVTFGVDENVVIPDMAVIKQQGSGVRNVYVYNPNGTVSIRTVQLGRHFDSKYEVLSGIYDGEQVVVKGLSTLRDGIKVELQK